MYSWSVIFIILIIILIIICISYGMNKESVEFFNFDGLTAAQLITGNNTKINTLLNQLENINPDVKLVNYDVNKVYADVENSLTSNIGTLNTILANQNSNSNETKINKLENTIQDLENIVNKLGLVAVNDKKYNTIKSLNNGMEIQLISTPNTVFKDHKTGSNIAGYMVNINKGCLSVGAADYDVYQCDDKNPKQIFKMEHIMNETAYQNNIDTALPADNTDKANINYPFVMMKSTNNENCLTNNHGNLTVQPCYSFVAQRWFPL